MHTVKIIGSRCELISLDDKRTKFSELYDLIQYANSHNITIINKNELPHF